MPKLILLSTDDEFMMMDWTNMYYDRLTNNTGESHILIVPNTDHILFTNLYGEFATIGSFVRSIASNHKSRPSFKYTYNPTDGSIKVRVSDRNKVKKVMMRHAETL